MSKAPRLTNKQAAFVREYLIDLNATQAAIRAGYSEKTAYSQGQRLLKHVEIQKRLQEGKDKRAERTELTADMVIEGILKEATREGEGSSHGARVSAWALLAKHLGMTREQVENTGEVIVRVKRE